MTTVYKVTQAIPSLPQGGGAYKDYLSQVEDLIGWDPAPMSGIGQDIQEAIQIKNDPSSWLAFAGKSIQRAWQALPADVRRKAIEEIEGLVANALQNLGDDIGSAVASSIGESVSNAVPIIGAIIDVIIQTVTSVVKVVKSSEKTNKFISKVNLVVAQGNTVEDDQTSRRLSAPDAWVFHPRRVKLYAKYVGVRGGGDWTAVPSVRSSTVGDLMFVENAGPADRGWCGNGVAYRCPEFSDPKDIGDDFPKLKECDPKPERNAGKECVRYIAVSALFFPFWSPAYGTPKTIEGDLPGYVYNGQYKRSSAIKTLAQRQFALLTIPNVNLQVDGDRLLEITDRFKRYWDVMIAGFAPENEDNGLLRIDHNGYAPGTAREDRLVIDDEKNPDNVPSKQNMHRFYYDDNGLIHAYDNAPDASINDWGVRSKVGDNRGLSIGAYNAVIGNTLAFFSARANFLRNGPIMKALLMDFGEDYFDAGVRAAMNYAADYGSMLPTSSEVLGGESVIHGKKLVKANANRYKHMKLAGLASSSSSAGPLLLLGGAAVALMVLKGKRR